MSRSIRRRILLLASAFALLTVFILGVHLLLLYTDRGFEVVIAGKRILQLGGFVQSVWSQSIESAFEKKIGSDGQTIRIPKYVANVIVDHEVEGILYAHEFNSLEQRRYRFNNDTSYICAAPDMVTVHTPQSVNPKIDLVNYGFIFNGDAFRGNLAPDALNNFRQDLISGDPAKLYLLRPMQDKDGTYPLVHVILFTSNSSCVNTSYNGEAIPDTNVTPNAK